MPRPRRASAAGPSDRTSRLMSVAAGRVRGGCRKGNARCRTGTPCRGSDAPGRAWEVAVIGVPDRARCACRPHHRERTRHGTCCRRPTLRVAPRSRAERHREPGRDPKRHCPYGGSPTMRTHPKTPPNVRSANPTGNVPTKMRVTTRASPPRLAASAKRTKFRSPYGIVGPPHGRTGSERHRTISPNRETDGWKPYRSPPLRPRS